MKLQIVGCSHHVAPVEFRERLAFPPDQVREALGMLRDRFPDSEAVLLSTCNRVELYAAAVDEQACPTHEQLVGFLARYHDLAAVDIVDGLFDLTGEAAVRHLFTVASSLDSMVLGESQILSQVKRAYETAMAEDSTGPITHSLFQEAIRVAKRVTAETAIQQARVSIPSVAVSVFARGIFERFDDKRVLVVGAGEMGEETLRYLLDEGARDITIVNRDRRRAERLAERIRDASLNPARVDAWENLLELVVAADVMICTTGAEQPVIRREDYLKVAHRRYQRPLFILDLAIPRDVEPAVEKEIGVYLYCIDDLRNACEANRRSREKEWPAAVQIVEDETIRFMNDLAHRSAGPTIQRLRNRYDQIKQEELERLFHKLGETDPRHRKEIVRSFDRLVNKMLHPPLESLRDESHEGHGLLDALIRLFQLKD